jgi:hypothetical protein
MLRSSHFYLRATKSWVKWADVQTIGYSTIFLSRMRPGILLLVGGPELPEAISA